MEYYGENALTHPEQVFHEQAHLGDAYWVAYVSTIPTIP